MSEALAVVKKAQDSLYVKCGLNCENFFPENESSEYYAHTFIMGGKKGLFRIAKKTPTKVGWFVTIWKRGTDGIIAPYDAYDAIDFVVVAVLDGNHIGEFIFPKSVLIQKNLFTSDGKEGKRAIRVYTPWDKTISAQAVRTAKWQGQFFVDLNPLSSESVLKIKRLYNSEAGKQVKCDMQ